MPRRHETQLAVVWVFIRPGRAPVRSSARPRVDVRSRARSTVVLRFGPHLIIVVAARAQGRAEGVLVLGKALDNYRGD